MRWESHGNTELVISFRDHGSKPYFGHMTSYCGRTDSTLTLLPSIKLQKRALIVIIVSKKYNRDIPHTLQSLLAVFGTFTLVTIMFRVVGKDFCLLYAKQDYMNLDAHSSILDRSRLPTLIVQYRTLVPELLCQNSLYHPFHYTQAAVSEAFQSWISSSDNTLNGALVQFEVLIIPYADAYSYC